MGADQENPIVYAINRCEALRAQIRRAEDDIEVLLKNITAWNTEINILEKESPNES